jgi:TolB-like protein
LPKNNRTADKAASSRRRFERDSGLRELQMVVWRRLSFIFLLLTIICANTRVGGAESRPIPRLVAICPFQSAAADDKSNAPAAVISDLLTVALADAGGIAVVDHTVIDAALRETALANSGLVREADAMLIGRLVKADLAIAGIYSRVGNSSRVAIRAIDPKSGMLLDTGIIAVDLQALDSSVSAFQSFILKAAGQTEQQRKKRHIAFGRIEVPNSGPWTPWAAEIKSRLQKHYLAHPDIAIVVRSQIDAMLVERYLSAADHDAPGGCLAATPRADVIVDIAVVPTDDASRVRVKVKSNIIGLAPHIDQFQLDAGDAFLEQLTARLDDILVVHWGHIHRAHRELAERRYRKAMNLMRFSYRNGYFTHGTMDGFKPWLDVDPGDLKTSVTLFEKTLELVPNHARAMVGLAHCCLYKKMHAERRAEDLLRKVYIITDDFVLKRIAKERIRDGKISEQTFETLIPRPEALLADLKARKFIDAKGYVLNAFTEIEDPGRFALAGPFDPIKDQVFYLLKETTRGHYSQPKYGTSSPEALEHFMHGRRLGCYRFKPKGSPGDSDDTIAEYLEWQFTFPPEVVLDGNVVATDPHTRSDRLNAAVNEYAAALFLDPQFYEAMVMLAECLRDPLIDQGHRADQLLEMVLAGTSDEYLKYLAADKLKKLDQTGFSHKLNRMRAADKRFSPVSRQDSVPRSTPIRAAGQPRQAVTLIHPVPSVHAGRRSTQAAMPQEPTTGPTRRDSPDPEVEPSGRHEDAAPIPSKSNLQSCDAAIELESAGNPDRQDKGSASASKYFPADRHSWVYRIGASVAITAENALIGSPGSSPKYPPYGARRGGGAAFLFKKAGGRWRYVSRLTGEEPAWMNSDHFGEAVAIGRRFAIVGAPLDKDKGPLQLRAIRKIDFESDVDPVFLMDKLFSLGYLDVNKIPAIDIGGLENRLRRDFMECSSKDLRRIAAAVKASLTIKNTGTATIFDVSADPRKAPLTLRAFDAHEENRFGRCVAINARHAVVGSTSGLYFFERENDRWRPMGKLSIGSISACDLSGDTLIAGIRTNSPQGAAASVRFYRFEQNQWQMQTEVFPDRYPENSDDRLLHFGQAVAIAGDYAAVGNPFEDFGIQEEMRIGSVTIYRRNHDQWQPYATLSTGPQPEPTRLFGGSVDMDGTHVIVGEYEATKGGTTVAGVVHIYQLRENGIEYSGRVAKRIPLQAGRFGSAVAVDGKQMLIGAVGEDEPVRNSGAAYFVNIP